MSFNDKGICSRCGKHKSEHERDMVWEEWDCPKEGPVPAKPKEELCSVCKERELTGAVFIIRLRTAKDKEHVGPSRNICDECGNLIGQLFLVPDLYKKLKELMQ